MHSGNTGEFMYANGVVTENLKFILDAELRLSNIDNVLSGRVKSIAKSMLSICPNSISGPTELSVPANTIEDIRVM